jgi:hypothetical protein
MALPSSLLAFDETTDLFPEQAQGLLRGTGPMTLFCRSCWKLFARRLNKTALHCRTRKVPLQPSCQAWHFAWAESVIGIELHGCRTAHGKLAMWAMV